MSGNVTGYEYFSNNYNYSASAPASAASASGYSDNTIINGNTNTEINICKKTVTYVPTLRKAPRTTSTNESHESTSSTSGTSGSSGSSGAGNGDTNMEYQGYRIIKKADGTIIVSGLVRPSIQRFNEYDKENNKIDSKIKPLADSLAQLFNKHSVSGTNINGYDLSDINGYNNYMENAHNEDLYNKALLENKKFQSIQTELEKFLQEKQALDNKYSDVRDFVTDLPNEVVKYAKTL